MPCRGLSKTSSQARPRLEFGAKAIFYLATQNPDKPCNTIVILIVVVVVVMLVVVVKVVVVVAVGVVTKNAIVRLVALI